MRPGTRPAGSTNRRGRPRRWWARSTVDQAAGAGRPGGGSGASPSAARGRRTAGGSVTAPRSRRRPPQRSHPSTFNAEHPLESPSPGPAPRGARVHVSGVGRRRRRHEGRSPARPRAEEPMVGQQRSARRRHEGRQAPQQLPGIEEQRRGAVAPRPAELIPELPPRALRQPRHGQGWTQEVAADLHVRPGRTARAAGRRSCGASSRRISSVAGSSTVCCACNVSAAGTRRWWPSVAVAARQLAELHDVGLVGVHPPEGDPPRRPPDRRRHRLAEARQGSTTSSRPEEPASVQGGRRADRAPLQTMTQPSQG
jgi:hypothetical protein